MDNEVERFGEELGNIPLNENDVLVLINSQKGLDGGAPPHLFLDVLFDTLPDSVTIVAQTFNWNFFKGKKYHHKKTIAQTGILSEFLRRTDGVTRSRHPVYSFVAIGPQAEKICAHTGDTCWGEGTPLEALSVQNALWVNLGHPFPYGIEMLHRTEEVFKVPYRFFKEFKGVVDFGAGEEEYSTRFFARPLALDLEYNWDCAVRLMEERGQIYAADSFSLTAVRSHDLESACYECMDNNPLCFLSEPDLFKKALKEGIVWE